MNDNAAPIELLFKKVEDFSKTTIELLQLKAIDKTADVVSTLVAQLAIIIAAALAILILNIGVALWIGNLLNNSFCGFFIVGGFYTIIAIILCVYNVAWIKKPLNNTLIKLMLKQNNS